MTPFSAVGLELWSMTSDIFFDNFLITDDRNTADRWANDGWGLKKAAESAAEVGAEAVVLRRRTNSSTSCPTGQDVKVQGWVR